MTPERFAEIDRLFSGAIVLPLGQRAAFLASECPEDDVLRAEVESLLAADESGAGRIHGAIENAAAGLPVQTPSGDAGLQVGPYLLVRELGRGGMGAVYQAVRSDGEFFQTVAVKLVKRGMDSDAIVHRFRVERQILASLSHPNIAALLDGGSSTDGRPYLVMEYVQGQPLLEYADSRKLGVRERVELFRPICRAVDYAHRRHVLHRDLKPSNVMVNKEGVPKLLDFGVAKLLLPELMAGGVPDTQTHARLLTPDYASPEQIRGEDLTPATDIYSLGVVLYRLLAGRQPYSITGRALSEIERDTSATIPPPSEVASDPQVRAQLAGDLDVIIAMAMRREPERRYASAAALDEDLARHLSGEPIQARPDTLSYRVHKWSRRHGLAAAAATGITVLGATALRQWQLREAGHVPPEALELCRRAEQLMRNDIRASRPGQGLPEPLREAITLWTRAAEIAPRHVPAWTGLAGTAEFAIDYDAARSAELWRIADQAAQTAVRLDPNAAAAHSVLGSLQLRSWNFADAAEEFSRSIAIDPHQPYVVADRADCLAFIGRHEEAIEILERALDEISKADADRRSDVRAQAVLLSSLAGHYRNVGRFELGRARAERAIQLQSSYSPGHIQLGLILEQIGDAAGAERAFQTAFAIRPGDQRTIAALGHLYAVQGRLEEARKMLVQVEALRDDGLLVHGSLAIIRAGLGETDLALDALETSVRARDSGAPYRFSDSRLHAILSTPRAQSLASEMGLAGARR